MEYPQASNKILLKQGKKYPQASNKISLGKQWNIPRQAMKYCPGKQWNIAQAKNEIVLWNEMESMSFICHSISFHKFSGLETNTHAGICLEYFTQVVATTLPFTLKLQKISMEPTGMSPSPPLHQNSSPRSRHRLSQPTQTYQPDFLLKNHIRVNNLTRDRLLFSFTSPEGFSLLTKSLFLQCCNDIWIPLGYPHTTGHCFRIRGTTELLIAGISPEVMKVTGHWSSKSFHRYWCSLDNIAPQHIWHLPPASRKQWWAAKPATSIGHQFAWFSSRTHDWALTIQPKPFTPNNTRPKVIQSSWLASVLPSAQPKLSFILGWHRSVTSQALMYKLAQLPIQKR